MALLPRTSTRFEAAFTRLFILVAAVSWVGTLLTEAGAFAPGRVLVGAGVLAVAAWAWFARELRVDRFDETSRSMRAPIGLAIILVAAAGLYAKPGEYLIEGSDASVYLAIGHTIARTGGLAAPDPVLQLLPEETRDALLARDKSWPRLSNRFPGGIQVAAGGGDRVAPNFFHLLPVWIAVFVGAFGSHGGYYVNAVFGVLAVLATWLIGRRAWSTEAGTIAAVLLAVNFAEMWYARTTSSEMVAQWFLLAGIFFTLVAADRQTRVAGACAGTAIGLAGFARIDTLIVLLPLGVAWLVLARRRRLLGRAWSWYAATLGLVGAHAIAHAVFVSTPYTLRLAATVWNAGVGVITAFGVWFALAAAAGLAGLWLATKLAPSGARLPGLAGLAVVAAAIMSPDVARTASVLLTPAGAIAVVVSFVWVAYTDRDRRLLPLVAPFAVEAVLWIAWRERTTWPADFRRFVPVVLPLGFLFVGALAAHVAGIGRWPRRGAWIAVTVLAAMWLGQAWPILRTPPMQGVHAEVEPIARHLPAEAIVISDRSSPSHLALALQAIFGRDGIQLTERVPPGGAFHAFIDRALTAGRRVYVMLAGYQTDLPRHLWRSDLEGLRVAPAFAVPLAYTLLESSAVTFPRRLAEVRVGMEVYEVGREADAPPVALPFTADFGERDFAFALRGFYAGESMPSAHVRWTTGQAQVAIPRLAIGGPGATLVVRLATRRPDGVAAPTVRVDLDGSEIGVIVGPRADFSEYRLALDGAAVSRLRAGDSILMFYADTFVPKAAGVGNDTRVLGVALDWIRLQ